MAAETGGTLLHRRNPRSHDSADVGNVVSYLRRSGVQVPNQPSAKLDAFLSFLADDVKDGVLTGDPKSIRERIEVHVIAAEAVPESYFRLQQRVLKEMGLGEVTINDDVRQEMVETLREDQRDGLALWAEYLTEGDLYPQWFRYYVWESVTRLGPYTASVEGFQKRSKGTAARFPDLNREALSNVYNAVSSTDSPEASFAKLYADALQQCGSMSPEQRAQTNGVWVKYEQSNSPQQAVTLAKSLQPWGTGWCTAGAATAHAQLKSGDFYVYRTVDANGEPIVPRLAIRMEDGLVAEVRGVNPEQEVEPHMLDILEDKLQELPGGERYQRIADDMRRVTALDSLTEQDSECVLANDDIRFLYEVDRPIDGFGWVADPRVATIQARRNVKSDLAVLFETTPDRISTTKDEALSGGILFHLGHLALDVTSLDGIEFPRRMTGHLNLSNLRDASGPQLPDYVGGYLIMDRLTSIDGVRLPRHVDGDADFSRLRSVLGGELPDYVGGDLVVSGLTSVQGFQSPGYLGGVLHISGLTDTHHMAVQIRRAETTDWDVQKNIDADFRQDMTLDAYCSDARSQRPWL